MDIQPDTQNLDPAFATTVSFNVVIVPGITTLNFSLKAAQSFAE
ncbi:hypothetical protein [Accumulibacter sp.]|nr:hypothetical protein [Accumulibacter sp.]